MAKKKQKNGYDLKKELSLDEQREVYNAVKKANKRIANIEKSGMYSHAVDMIKPYMGINKQDSVRFSTTMKYKDLKSFQHMQSTLDLFLSSASSASRSISPLTCATMRCALPIHSPAVRATTGSFSGPSTTSATAPITTSSEKPKSNIWMFP